MYSFLYLLTSRRTLLKSLSIMASFVIRSHSDSSRLLGLPTADVGPTMGAGGGRPASRSPSSLVMLDRFVMALHRSPVARVSKTVGELWCSWPGWAVGEPGWAADEPGWAADGPRLIADKSMWEEVPGRWSIVLVARSSRLRGTGLGEDRAVSRRLTPGGQWAGTAGGGGRASTM